MKKSTQSKEKIKFGRPRKYSPAEFRDAVERYFDSITTEQEAKDELGRPIINRLGEAVRHVVYIVPPSISGLCVALKIDRSTLDNYAADEEHPEYKRVIEWTKQLIRAYLEEELLVRRKGIQGVIFNLQNNYGWREKKEVEIGADTRKDMGASLSLEEKLKIISEASTKYAQSVGEDASASE